MLSNSKHAYSLLSVVIFCFDVCYWPQRLNGAHVSYADDGGGMDPNSIRKCMSLGYSSKKSKTTIGQCI